MRLSKKLTAGLATGIAAISIATGAFAYFTADGSGAGSATVGRDGGVTITVPNATAGLYPGGSVELDYTVKNNSSSTEVVIERLYASIEVDGDHSLCDADDFSFATAFSNVRIGKGATVAGDGTLSMVDAGHNQDACKDAMVTVTLDTNPPAPANG